MIESPKTDYSQVRRFTEQPYRDVLQLWGAPLLVGLNNELHFEELKRGVVRLTVRDADGKVAHEIDMDYTAEQLCATKNEIDIVFRFKQNGELAFDQDHEDNGAPSNGGSTGTGRL